MKNLVKKFMTSALLGFSAFLSSGVALAHGQSSDSVKQETNFKLHASPETLKFLGDEYASKLTEWAQTDVLVLTIRDINELSQTPSKKDIVKKLKEKYPDFPIPSDSKDNIINLSTHLTSSSDSSPAAYGFSANRSMNNTHCVIFLHDRIDSSSYFYAAIGSQEQADVQNLKSKGSEWFYNLIAHEAYHCRQNYNTIFHAEKSKKTLLEIQYEAEADAFALNLQTRDTDFVKEWSRSRASSILSSGMQHHIYTQDTNATHAEVKSQELLDGYIYMWEKISEHESISSEIRTFSQAAFLLLHLKEIEGKNNAFSKEALPLYRELEGNINNTSAARQLASLIRMKELDLMMSEDPFKKQIAKSLPMAIQSELSPYDVYTIAKDVFNKGGFNGNAIAKRNVELFLEGTENHVPSQMKPKPAIPKPEARG